MRSVCEELGQRRTSAGPGETIVQAVSALQAPARLPARKLRRIDGWRKIAAVLSQHTAVAA
jgi:hypothetical protein